MRPAIDCQWPSGAGWFCVLVAAAALLVPWFIAGVPLFHSKHPSKDKLLVFMFKRFSKAWAVLRRYEAVTAGILCISVGWPAPSTLVTDLLCSQALSTSSIVVQQASLQILAMLVVLTFGMLSTMALPYKDPRANTLSATGFGALLSLVSRPLLLTSDQSMVFCSWSWR